MNNIVFLNLTNNYPHSFSANNTKVEFIAKGLLEQGNSVATFNSCILGTEKTDSLKIGTTQFGFSYYILPEKKWFRFLSNFMLMLKLLKERKSKSGKNVIVMGMDYFPISILLILLAKISGYKSLILFHEWHLGFQNQSALHRVDAFFRDYFLGFFVNGVLPISHYIQQKSKLFSKPNILLPILADFKLPRLSKYNNSNMFSFCGHAGYLLRYSLILESFVKVVSVEPTSILNLVIFGYDWQIKEVEERLNNLGIAKNVCIRTQVSMNDLNKIYDESLALLIPLEPFSLQDKARFSQKIAEYLASGRPVITTSVGEIPFYFTDGENAVICEYDASAFSDAMLKLLRNKEYASKVGYQGKKVGKEYFDYRINGQLLNVFINNKI